MAAPRPRQAGRAILRDAHGRVLLIRFVLPNMTFWATPGGGVEPGETLLQAARRELKEELGIAVELEGPVHTAVGIFEFGGELIENTDNFFTGRWDGETAPAGRDGNRKRRAGRSALVDAGGCRSVVGRDLPARPDGGAAPGLD